MGWTGIFDAIRKSNGQIDRKATLEREFAGWKHTTGETVMLKGSMAGSVFYAAMQTTTKNGVDVWALVVLTSVNGVEFRYKEMTEDEHPYYFSCPISILNALTPTTNENANAWRQKCMEEYSKKKTTAGRIPRNATQIYITFLVDTSASKKGYSTMIYKSNGKWIYKDKNGRLWRVCASMLRNSDVIQVNGTEEPKNAPTGEETPEPVQTTTTTENEPENGTQAAKTTYMETFKKEYSRIYNHLYEHEGQPGVDATRRKYSRLFDESWEDIKDIVKAFCQKSGDLLTSDRQCAAFMKALETVGTPTDGAQGQEAPTDGQTPTAGDIEPHRATETASAAADTDEAGTAAARLDESRTDRPTPPPLEGNHTEPREACEIAPERTERGTPEQIPTTDRKTPYRANLRATRRRSEIPRIEENRIFARLSYPHFAGTSYPHRGYLWGGLPPQKNNAIQGSISPPPRGI